MSADVKHYMREMSDMLIVSKRFKDLCETADLEPQCQLAGLILNAMVDSYRNGLADGRKGEPPDTSVPDHPAKPGEPWHPWTGWRSW